MHPVSWILLLPLLGAVVVLVIPQERIGWIRRVAAVAGLTLAYGIYQKKWQIAPGLRAVGQKFRTVLIQKYFIDEIYAWINQNVQQRFAVLLSLFERYVIIGVWANGIAKTTGLAGNVVRRAQSGRVQTYAMAFLAGLALILYLAAGWQCTR